LGEHKGHFPANVATARDLITNVLYDVMVNERPSPHPEAP